MFGFNFVKFQPSEYVMKVKNGKVVREGVGLSFITTPRPPRLLSCPSLPLMRRSCLRT